MQSIANNDKYCCLWHIQAMTNAQSIYLQYNIIIISSPHTLVLVFQSVPTVYYAYMCDFLCVLRTAYT